MAYYTQHYDPFRIAVSYFISAVAAHCAVITLDHERWRETSAVKDMELKELMRAPFWYASIAVGAGSIWAMHSAQSSMFSIRFECGALQQQLGDVSSKHQCASCCAVVQSCLQHFLGMSALSLKHPVTGAVAPMQFAPGFTVFSVCIGVLCMRAGFWIMQQDVFATAKRGEVLKTMLHAKITNIEKTRSNEGKRMVIYTAFFSNLHYMFAGALLAALGVCLMHYCGMIAMWAAAAAGTLLRLLAVTGITHQTMSVHCSSSMWSPGIVAASVIIAVVVANAGFWILFRLLLWKHYTGMAAAKYLVVERTGSAPAGSFKHCTAALIVGIAVRASARVARHLSLALAVPIQRSLLLPLLLSLLLLLSGDCQCGAGPGDSSAGLCVHHRAQHRPGAESSIR
eukprot:11975-Heterococcus_DN1.PRE.1